MTYTFNYTERAIIPREAISISVSETGEEITLSGSVDLSAESYPNAELIVEAYRRNQRWNFYCGPATGKVMLDLTFPLFAAIDSIMYVIKVVSEEESSLGKILAVRRSVRPDQGADGILPFVSRDLGQMLWRLDTEDTESDMPEVQVNSRLDDIQTLGMDQKFRAIAMPEIARQLAEWLREQLDSGESAGDHIDDLVEFYRSLGVDPKNESGLEWIDTAVSTFCKKHSFVDRWKALEELS